MPYRKKLIEVSLPLEAINAESAREKSIRHGHPSTLHLWWARRPLAACRAVLWSSLVDDPSEYMPDEESANGERERLFSILEKLVKWENINNEEVLDAAKLEIARSVARDLGCEVPVGKEAIREFLTSKAPPVLDPFAGGGSIPLESQRLGLRTYASDLNPVPVLINKAMVELPLKSVDMPPLHPPEPGEQQSSLLGEDWKGAEGLAEDIRYYGNWMRDEVKKRIGYLYPEVTITPEIILDRDDLRKQGIKLGDKLTIVAWLWARSVKCPNPVCQKPMPLVRTFQPGETKVGKVFIEPYKDAFGNITFRVKVGSGKPLEGTVRNRSIKCLSCDSVTTLEYVREEAQAGRMGRILIGIIAETSNGIVYLSPDEEQEKIALEAEPLWRPDEKVTTPCHDVDRLPMYGMYTWGDAFSDRQLTALTNFSEMLKEVYKLILDHLSRERGIQKHDQDYAIAIVTYLAFALDRCTNYWSSLTPWGGNFIVQTFGRQAIPMVWDVAEGNPFSDSTGNWAGAVDWIKRVIVNLPLAGIACVKQHDAAQPFQWPDNPIISTDPPYYDNVSYAELSDFFYVWLRRSLQFAYPELLATILTPKTNELIAASHRFNGDKNKAKDFFENGLRQVFKNIRNIAHLKFPITVFYAFKQTENSSESNNSSSLLASTGWETMLEGLIGSDLQITGTWPMRTERDQGLKTGTNVLASSIVLVCRPRLENAPTAIRREFLSALKRELPTALRQLQLGNIAPVDLAQAAIGPGMAIFSRYNEILEADGSHMRVRAALAMINQALDEYLAEQEGEYDADTRWALAWYEQYGHEPGPYGVAETLSKAKNTSVEGLSHAGFLEARSGKVRLLRRDELDANWDPSKDTRLTAWEAVQHLIRALDKDGEKSAGALLGKLGSVGETARDLAYRLYTICERKGWAQEALAYNMLVVAWPRIKEQSSKGLKQDSLL